MVDDAPRGRPKRPRSVDAGAHSAPSGSDSLHSCPKKSRRGAAGLAATERHVSLWTQRQTTGL